jgi:hypothetical protein
VYGLWRYGVGAGAPLIGTPLGKHLLSGARVWGDPISRFQHAGLLTGPTAFVLAREGFGEELDGQAFVVPVRLGVGTGVAPICPASASVGPRSPIGS